MSLKNQKLTNLLSDDSFIRWINGKASSSEEKYWENWLHVDPLNRELKREAEMMCQYPWELDDASDIEKQLSKLDERIKESSERSKLNLVSKKLEINEDRKNKSNISYKWVIAAAIILILSAVSVLAVYEWQNSTAREKEPLYTTIEVDEGEKGSLKISDGSHIQLNAGASLRYSSEQFNTNQVEVWLKGEGYFNISNKPNGVDREFIVHTAHSDIQVLGTKFNVNTRLETTSVVLEEGKVRVTVQDSIKNNRKVREMAPGERAVIAGASGDISVQKIDVHLFTSWVEGEMKLNNTPLRQVVEAIEAKYSVSIEAENDSLLNKRMTGKIHSPDLKALLAGLEKMLEANVEQKNENKFLITK